MTRRLVFSVVFFAMVLNPALSSAQQVYHLSPAYGPRLGIVTSADHLGIGFYRQQVADAERLYPRGEINFVLPNDGIKKAGDKTYYRSPNDTRLEIYDIPDPRAKENAKAVASISKASEARQFRAAICTAFLIASDIAMTASHCINFEDYPIKVVRFNDQQLAPGRPGNLDVYPIENVLAWDRSHDFSLIRLKANPKGQLPGEIYRVLQLSKAPVRRGTKLYMIGHAANESKKLSGDCSVVVEKYFHPKGKYTFGCDCTAFGGNSGSPVFDASTHLVVGVLWGGQQDTRFIPLADAQDHEFVVPMSEIAVAKELDEGTWPRGITFQAMAAHWLTSMRTPLGLWHEEEANMYREGIRERHREQSGGPRIDHRIDSGMHEAYHCPNCWFE